MTGRYKNTDFQAENCGRGETSELDGKSVKNSPAKSEKRSENRSEKHLKNGRALTWRNYVTAALLCAVICVVSPFSLPIFSVPVTLSLFAVYLCAFLSKSVYFAILPVTLYVCLGCFGLPVFSSGTAGLTALLSHTGGFIIGYIPCVALIALAKRRIGKFASGLLGTITLYFCGSVWYAVLCKMSVFYAIYVCVLPFVLFDVLKLIFAIRLSEKLTSVLKIK